MTVFEGEDQGQVSSILDGDERAHVRFQAPYNTTNTNMEHGHESEAGDDDDAEA